MKKVLAWLAVPLALALVVAGAWLAVGPLKLASVFGSTSESRNTQLINSVTREQQVVLLSLGIQGIAERTGKSNFLGVDVPGSDKATFVQYEFTAKLGLEGKDVHITQTGEHAYLLTVPEFIFIGHSNESFRTIVQNNGVLSFTTPEIDTAAMITSILNDEAQAQYIAKHKDVLKDQAKVFYTNIITGVDPESSVTLAFTD